MANMNQSVIERSQDPIAYAANSKTTIRLGRGMLLREIRLRLTGSLTCTSANNIAANTLRGDEWGLVRSIDLIANGNDTVRSFTGNELFWINKLLYGRNPSLSPNLGPASDPTGNANPTFDSTLILPLWQPQANRPMDTVLNTAKLSDLRLEITWGSHVDINASATAIAAAAAGATQSGQAEAAGLTVHTLESYFNDGEVMRTYKPALSRMYGILSNSLSAVANGQRVDLPVQPLYRGFLINAYNQASPAVDNPTLIRTVRLKSGPNIIREIPWTVLVEQSRARFNIQSDTTAAAVTTGAFRFGRGEKRSSSAAPFAWAWWDMLTDGNMNECVDSQGLSELYIEFDTKNDGDVTTAGFARVLPMQITPASRY